MTSTSGQEVAGMDTWGISGPGFLLLYVALFAVTLLAVRLARRRALGGPDAAAAVPARLDTYEAAYLNGGGGLVATTAVSNLLRSGVLGTAGRRRGRPVRLVARAAPTVGVHPVEWATYELVAGRAERPLGEVQAGLGRSPALAALRERLRLGGLVPTPEQRVWYRATALWYLPLLGLGLARLAAGSANGRPVGFLVVLLAANVVVAAVGVLRVPHATTRGRQTLGRLRAETRRPTPGASPAELGMATALFGAGVLWGADAETALAMRLPREHGAGLGGIGGEGGGGCGGGGGGGGGCGGGGGGGCGGGGCGG
jgi:uncharacterized protein (TIGR04222 family)